VPKGKFEELVESAKPPTITKLAELGKTTRKPLVDLRGRNPEHFKLSTDVQGELRRMVNLAECARPDHAAAGAFERERREMLKHVKTISGWMVKLTKAIRRANENPRGRGRGR
jgi:hypothetical protein